MKSLAIDVGNTRTKAAVFRGKELLEHFVFDDDPGKGMRSVLEKHPDIGGTIVSAVRRADELEAILKQSEVEYFYLSHTLKLPYESLYKSPETLGRDRMALVAGGMRHFPGKNILVVDAGTCVTYDLLDSEKRYHGGAISPGLEMRFKALAHYTGQLPLVERTEEAKLTGRTTKDSILSGVVNGMSSEIEGMIEAYGNEFKDLRIILTGGDSDFLSGRLKSSIFARPSVLLEGLNEILIYNRS